MSDTRPGAAKVLEGAVSSLPLADVLQIEGANHFSGSITVSFGGRQGQIYFQNGQIIHAEALGRVGEAAVREILAWPEGTFSVHSNVSTIEHSIDKSLNHLLLEVYSQIDEANRDAGPAGRPVAEPHGAPPGERTMSTLLDRIRTLNGVAGAVQFNSEGSPFGEPGRSGEQLVAKGMYLASMVAAPIGRELGLGAFFVASLHSEDEQFLLFQSRGQYLAIAIAATAAIEEVEAEVRRLLKAPAEG